MTKQEILKSVESGKIHYCCSDCANKHREDGVSKYNGIYTVHTSECEICGEKKAVTSARKLFGIHQFI